MRSEICHALFLPSFCMKKILPLFAFLILSACAGAETVIDRPIDPPSSSSIANASSASIASSSGDATTDTPEKIRINMGFASQAPHGNWDMPYQEACEEASLILVHHYLEGTSVDANVMDRDILDMVAFEESKGLPVDIDMFQLADVAREKYGYDAEVVEGNDVSIERIESELAKGNPVIVPLAGQDIGNPYYSGDGPPYHVLVILGYDGRNFTTHDVGTRQGANYTYRKEVIMSAIHDWNGSTATIRSGPRRLLVVTK
jgi:hypothetical protein